MILSKKIKQLYLEKIIIRFLNKKYFYLLKYKII